MASVRVGPAAIERQMFAGARDAGIRLFADHSGDQLISGFFVTDGVSLFLGLRLCVNCFE